MLRRFPMSELKFYDVNFFKLYNPFYQVYNGLHGHVYYIVLTFDDICVFVFL